jgi:two-component system response regulator (stage 0 sporulation protein F)
MSTESTVGDLIVSPPSRLSTRVSNIIVAEDDEDLRALVVSGLRQDGHHIIAARDGVELLEYIASTLIFDERASYPDVIVTDIRMPGFSGMSVLAGLRDQKWTTPIIVMTAYSDPKTRSDAARLGASAFFAKPFDLDDLRTAVINLIPKRFGHKLGSESS